MKQQCGGSAGTKPQNQIAAAAKKYRKWFVIGPVFKLTEAVFELLIPTLMVYVIDRGVSGRDGAYVLKMIPLMLGIAVLGYLSALVCQYVASLSSQGFGTELRERLFRHLLSIPQKEADRLGTPTMVNRVTTDVNILQQAVAMLIRLAIRAPFICVGSLVMAAILNLKLTLVILCALPFLIAAVILVMRVSVPLFTKVQQKLDTIAVISRENMSGARVIRAFSRKNNEKARFDAECDGYNKAVEKVNRVSTLLNPLTTLIMNLAVLAVLWFGGKMIESGAMTGGKIIAFINYVSYMVTALLVVANLVTLFTKAAASYKRVNEIFAVPLADRPGTAKAAEAADPDADAREDEPTPPSVEFRHATLRYGDDESLPAAVEDVSLKLCSGQTLGIVGITGSGKTSLISLLTGLYDCTAGQVLLYGRDVRQWERAELHRTVRIAAQQSTLFAGTVRDNLRAGCADLDDEALWAALRAAQAAGFVEEKGGLDARVARGGVNFSGGQRQRLSVARAVAAGPRVLILDDSFSALDNATAAAMFDALRATSVDTLIIVSQRVRSVRGADLILALDDGRAAGLGPHEELLRQSPTYAEICRLSGDEAAEAATVAPAKGGDAS
ncbi:MAG: ABC transporter ATP-binding protein [Clostridia bacterium]|nr:ABC transporter ATP-binding protein [Clostridia bacterium]